MREKAELLAVPEDVLREMYMSEDRLPRSGGAWPEYAATITVCVDAAADGLLSGRVCGYYIREARRFKSLDQMLFVMEELLDVACVPMRDTELRRLRSVRARGPKSTDWYWARTPGLTRRAPAFRPHGLYVRPGRVADFYIRVYARLHASMQGIVVQAGKKPEAFRSEMELMHLIRCAVENPEN